MKSKENKKNKITNLVKLIILKLKIMMFKMECQPNILIQLVQQLKLNIK